MSTFSELLTKYLADASERCAPATVNFYQKRLHQLELHVGAKLVAELTADDVKAALISTSRWPDGRSKAPDTVRANTICWQQFQKWMKKHGHIGQLITDEDTQLPKPSGRKREDLPTKEETRKLLEHARDDFKPIYLALRLTAARPGELCRAQIGDIDRTTGEIILTEHKTAKKTGVPRRIAIGHPSLIEIINQAIGDRISGPIFLRASGRPWTTEALSAEYRRARNAAGLRKCLVPYLARHEHATRLYQTVNDLKAVADALGHKILQTTMRYTRVDTETLKANQKLFNDSLD